MPHITDAQWMLLLAVVAGGYAISLLERIRAELHAITYNTGKTSENVANLLHYLQNARRSPFE